MSEGKTPPPRERLDALLAEWPMRTSSPVEADDAADRVLGYLAKGAVGASAASVSDEELFRPPLPAATAELQGSPPVPVGAKASEGKPLPAGSRERGANLRNLARLAGLQAPPAAPAGAAAGPAERSTVGVQRPENEREENSGVIHLAALAQGGAKHVRGSAENEPAAKPAAEGDVAAVASAADPSPAPAVPIASSRRAAAAAVVMQTLRSAGNPDTPEAEAKTAPKSGPTAGPKSRPPSGKGWVWLGGLVALSAVAAAVLLGLQHPARLESPVATARAPSPPMAATSAAAPAALARTPERSTGAGPTEVTPPEDRAVDPLSLPQAQTGGAPPQAAATGTARAMAASGAPAAPAAAPGGASASDTPAVAATGMTSPAAHSGAGGANLEALMQQAAGVSSTPAPAPASGTAGDAPLPAPGSIPLKPSLGAIQGALGAALPAARACLGPDDPISHATVTFRSDGSVESVSVSGGAAGKAAEGCIRGALGKARVPPFVQPSFTAPATIRPN
jgi:Meckel syndrome type 1 protein